MKKMTTLFKMNYTDQRNPVITPEVRPENQWVIDGEGVATRKWDGTSCRVKDGKLYARYDAKNGRVPPANFEPAQPEPDPVTGHWPGWVLVENQPEYKYHREAFNQNLSDGTYELVGPKVGVNADGFPSHVLIRHGNIEYLDIPRTFEGIKKELENREIEGFVFHHPDGRMCKIRRKDFGFPWPLT